jgi:hypothetical protein
MILAILSKWLHAWPNQRNQITKNLRPSASVASISFLSKVLPTLDNLRNFFLTPTTEMLSFLSTSARGALV